MRWTRAAASGVKNHPGTHNPGPVRIYWLIPETKEGRRRYGISVQPYGSGASGKGPEPPDRRRVSSEKKGGSGPAGAAQTDPTGGMLGPVFGNLSGARRLPRAHGYPAGELLQLIQTDTDFKAAFANLGRSIQRGEPVLDTLGDLWVDVFAGGGRVSSTYVNPRDHAPLYHEELAFLNARPTAVELLERRFGGLPAGAMSQRETVAEDVTVLPSAPEPVAYDGPLCRRTPPWSGCRWAWTRRRRR